MTEKHPGGRLNALRLLVCILAAATPLITAGCGSGAHRIPVIGLNGVAGAKPFMTPEQVVHAWKVTAPLYVNYDGSSSAWAYMPICSGDTHGGAIFFGPATNDFQSHSSLEAVWFQGGAQTDAGVRIGSSAAALSHAYGQKLRRLDPYTYALVGSPRVVATDYPPIRPVIVFSVFKGKVAAIGFGTHEQILGQGAAAISPDVVCP